MFDLLFIASIVGGAVQMFKEASEPVVPAENWENKKLYNEDIMRGVPIEQRMKNLENGKYRLEKKHPEPHRSPNGKIIIENCLLYENDLRKYGGVQTMEWVEQGKYNLNKEELKKENERIKADIEHLLSLKTTKNYLTKR